MVTLKIYSFNKIRISPLQKSIEVYNIVLKLEGLGVLLLFFLFSTTQCIGDWIMSSIYYKEIIIIKKNQYSF